MSTEVRSSYIELSLETQDFDGLKFNKGNFNKGVKDGSYLAGLITSLLNTGLEKQQVESVVCCILKNGLVKAE